jgi:hypothetical protein
MPNNRPPNRSGTRTPPPADNDYDAEPPRRRSGYQRQSVGEAVAKSFIRSIASSLGRILVRTITGRMR